MSHEKEDSLWKDPIFSVFSPRAFSASSAIKALDLLLPCHHKLRRPQQSPLDLGIREGADCFPRGIRIARGTSRRRFQRSIALQNFHDLRVGDAVESAVVQNGFNLAPFLLRATLQGVDHR